MLRYLVGYAYTTYIEPGKATETTAGNGDACFERDHGPEYIIPNLRGFDTFGTLTYTCTPAMYVNMDPCRKITIRWGGVDDYKSITTSRIQ